MSNALFQFMYTNWQPRDVWDIANDPSKYVIAISDMITTQFHVLGYKTKSGKLGEIYFQKWDKLEPPMDKDKLSEANSRNYKNSGNSKNLEDKRFTRRQRSEKGYPAQKQNAEIIAFYFVRIFQILGAMLLVVKDINIPNYNPETGEIIEKPSDNSSREFAQQSQQVISGFRPPTLKGGARSLFKVNEPLGPYDFLRYYLRTVSIPEDTARFSSKNINLDIKKEFMFEGSNTMIFEFTPDSRTNEISNKSGSEQRIGFGVEIHDKTFEKKFITVNIKSISFDIPRLGEQSVLQGYIAPSERDKDMRQSAYPIRVVLEFEHPTRQVRRAVTITRAPTETSSLENLNNGVRYQFSSEDNNLIDFLKAQGLHPKNNFVQMLENISMYYLKQKHPGIIDFIKFDTKKDPGEDKTGETKTRPLNNMSLKTTYDQLLKPEYRPHCISRALQLLDPASIGNFEKGSAVSNICKYAVGNMNSAKLSEYTPTRSVGQLFGKINPLDHKASIEVLKAFVQKDSSGNPLTTDGVNNTPSEVTELQAAIKRLSTAFGITYTNQKGLSEIDIQIPSKCDKNKGKTIEITKGSNKFRNMRSASQQLLAYHLKQIIEISKFLKKIFNISQRSDGSWKVEGPKTELLFAGFETMNTLTDQARALLINYYAGCEEIYQVGLKAWGEDVETAGDKALGKSAPVSGVVLPSAPVAPVPPVVAPVPASAPVAPPASAPPT